MNWITRTIIKIAQMHVKMCILMIKTSMDRCLPLIPHEPSNSDECNVEWSNFSDDSSGGIEGCLQSD